jgi:hypothetical protein
MCGKANLYVAQGWGAVLHNVQLPRVAGLFNLSTSKTNAGKRPSKDFLDLTLHWPDTF